jgi:hypothetical protein
METLPTHIIRAGVTWLARLFPLLLTPTAIWWVIHGPLDSRFLIIAAAFVVCHVVLIVQSENKLTPILYALLNIVMCAVVVSFLESFREI